MQITQKEKNQMLLLLKIGNICNLFGLRKKKNLNHILSHII